MLTGELKNKIDQIWNAFWSGGIANPIEVIEQITYLLFLRRLDDLQMLEENKSARLKQPIERRIFPEGQDARGRPFEALRWGRFKNEAPADMYVTVSEHVFPFLRTLGSDDSTYAHHMKDARFTIPTPTDTICDPAFSVERPILAFNALQTETERSGHKGFAALLKGCFSVVRNPMAHQPKLLWQGEDDVADYLSFISLLHRKLDDCVLTRM